MSVISEKIKITIEDNRVVEIYTFNNELNLSYAKLNIIPECLVKFDNLTILNISNNNIAIIPEYIVYLTKLKHLNLSHNNIIEIPEYVCNLINLELFNVSFNKLEIIPKCVISLVKLETLYLAHNKIKVIPDYVARLKSLKYLCLADNKISKIPDCIFRLVNLYTLILSGNKIKVIPEGIVSLTYLELLSLSYNKISVIPNFIARLTNLKKIRIIDNKIKIIPDCIENLSKLECLDVSLNLITTIPISITRCNQLREFEYVDNPVENIAPQVIRLLNRNRNVHNFQVYNDDQSIHNHSIQECIRISIENITSQSFGNINYDIVVSQILNDIILTENTKGLILEYVENMEAHSVLLITFKELLGYVWNTIIKMSVGVQKEVKQVMNSEMSDAECKCFTGRLSRLVNCLNGFSPLVRVEIADNQQISNIIVLVKQRLEGGYTIEKHKEIVKTEMTERGYDEAVITKWLEFIE
jgi:Leucine-rich repeat (LRR) protein